jgi:rubredoxin
MPASRPLSRSLVPIPGESLPGFLLRLSFRLRIPPAQLARLTGLAHAGHPGTSLPVTLLAGIPEPASRAFAYMTRLDADEVAELGMPAWQERYAPLVIGPEDTAPGPRRLNGQLILAPVTRYCPDCLAGDGSAVEESFGGPWLKAWHLPVVFACPAHQCLLEHLCPECGQPVRGRRPGTQFSLLPATRAAGLHPAQCRAELAPETGRHTLPACCGAWLDQPGNRQQASPGLLRLQAKILDLLGPGCPAATLSAGQPAQPPGYFADLRSIGQLACSTWPAARSLSPSEETASAIDEHVASLRRQAEGRQRAAAPSASRIRFGDPPANAAASAGLAHIADRLLAGSAGEVREQLRQLLPDSARKTGRTAWARRITRSSPPCSAGLQDACSPLLRGFTRAGGRPEGRRNPVLRPQHWGPEHIPAFLPEDWHARHFTPIDGVIPMFIRRTAVLRLVQMAAGGSLGEAAGFLGIASTDTTYESKGRIYSGAGVVHTGASRQPDPLGFETALSGLARELDDPATPLVNYQHRRQSLQTWRIDEDTWDRLTGQLPPVPGPQQPELGDRKRQIASVYVWVQVTSGEHYFAPRPIEAAQPPEIQEAWKERRNTIWHLIHRSRPSPHYTSLRAELNTIATSLARSIDTNRI